MILECKSCQKKFIVPDGAITSVGRLVQCSSCGNKWTQFPTKNKTVNEKKIIPVKIKDEKTFKTVEKKRKIVKKKSNLSIYTKEYLEKKHGIKIDGNSSKISKYKAGKKTSESYFGFYSYLILFVFSISLFIGILNLTKEIIIFNFPFAEIYIEYLFENLNNFKIIFSDALNIN